MTLLRAGAVVGALGLGALLGCSLLVETADLTCAGGACAGGDAGGAFDARADAEGSVPGIVGAADAAADADAGALPVAHLKLDEGTGILAEDSSGNANQGLLVNAPTWTRGRLGAALSFAGTDQYVRLASSASIDRLSSAATVTAWVYRLADQASFRAVVHRQAGTGFEDAFYLGFRDNAYYASVRTPSAGAAALLGTTAANAVWTHLGFTYDGTTVRLYVDGTERVSAAQTGIIERQSNPVTVGAGLNSGAPDEHVEAVIDDVRLYDRALSAAEMAALAAPPTAGN